MQNIDTYSEYEVKRWAEHEINARAGGFGQPFIGFNIVTLILNRPSTSEGFGL